MVLAMAYWRGPNKAEIAIHICRLIKIIYDDPVNSGFAVNGLLILMKRISVAIGLAG